MSLKILETSVIISNNVPDVSYPYWPIINIRFNIIIGLKKKLIS